MYILLFLIVLEFIKYRFDYNEVMILKEYVEFDYNNNITSFKTNKYEVIILDDSYTIIYYRNSIFNIKFLKNIEYHGII